MEYKLTETLVPCKEYTYLKYPFEYFNRLQSTILENKLDSLDNNLVLGTTTSSGKTISAELFMGNILNKNKKIIYCSPLKSLTQEKYKQWLETFSNYKICILTGDYALTKKLETQLLEADIVCVTSEMLDSRTRNYKSEKSSWIFNVGLIILDESHIISTSRGHAVEIGLLRFGKLVPKAQILLLSATMPNVTDFDKWLTIVNNKKTNIINSSWRPTELVWNYIEHGDGTYFEIRDNQLEIVKNLIMKKPNEKFLIFCWSKTQSRQLESNLLENKIYCKTHNADLNMATRLSTEDSFSDKSQKGLKILISTSTLAWGRSLPARNVIIVGTKRGLEPVDELDIIQAAGRAGRFGIDDKGFVFFICDDKNHWKYLLENPRKVESKLMDIDYLSFHILAEIKNEVIKDMVTLDLWLKKTLAYTQQLVNQSLVLATIEKLKFWGMIREKDGIFEITKVGLISASMYFLPKDVFHWKVSFSHIAKNNLWNSDLCLSFALGSTPSYSLSYISKADVERVNDYMESVSKLWGNPNLYNSLMACDLFDLLNGHKVSSLINGLKFDVSRIVNALLILNGIYGWDKNNVLEILPDRIQKGLSKEVAELCLIPGIGLARAKLLYDNGFKSKKDISKNKNKILNLLGQKIGEKVLKSVAVL